MADQVAGLEIRVESGSVDKAKKSLADLSAQGARAEASVKSIGDGSAKASTDLDRYSKSAKNASTENSTLLTSLKSTAAAYVGLRGILVAGAIADDYQNVNAEPTS